MPQPSQHDFFTMSLFHCLVKYTVTVKTGDVKNGETSAKIYIKIFGTSRKTGKVTATPPLHLTGAAPADKFLRLS